MMYRLVRITSNDYRDYRRSYEKIEYSFFKKGEEEPLLAQKVREMTKGAIKGKGEFLDEVEDSKRELYFFKNENDEIKGIAILVFDSNICDIYQFAVFAKGKGLGTLLYNEILKIIKEHKPYKITLFCPYEGASLFWKKQGFKCKSEFFLEKKCNWKS